MSNPMRIASLKQGNRLRRLIILYLFIPHGGERCLPCSSLSSIVFLLQDLHSARLKAAPGTSLYFGERRRNSSLQWIHRHLSTASFTVHRDIGQCERRRWVSAASP